MNKLFTSAVVLFAASVSFDAAAANRIQSGKALVDKYKCEACHGADYNTPIDPTYPKLAGQHRDYLEMAMIGYKRGAAGPNGRANPIMNAQVQPLSRQDIRNIAEYLNSLPGSLVLRR